MNEIETQVCMHSGSRQVTLEDLRLVPLPERTDSYQPVSHYDLVTNTAMMAGELLSGRGLKLTESRYSLDKDGNRMFAVMTFRNGVAQDYGYSIGLRNSYDKSMSVGIAFGARVFVCDNLAFSGSIVYMRKHTLNVETALSKTILPAIYEGLGEFKRFSEDVVTMKEVNIHESGGFQLLGEFYAAGALGLHQFAKAVEEWRDPQHDDFRERSLWSLYNCITAGMRDLPPHKILEQHVSIHKAIMARN
jgi:hypothetical protein